MNKSIFITRSIPEVGIKMLEDKGYRVDVYPKDRVPSKRELIKYLKKYPYDAVLCLLTDNIDAKVFDAVPSAKLFSTYTVGFNNIDAVEAKKRGITITNTSGSSRINVAEHAIALMLGLTTRMVEGDRFTRKGKYKGWTPMAFIGEDLTGSTIGLVGTGLIGSEVARILSRGFNSKIIYHDLNQNTQIENDCGAVRCTSLDELLKQADIVSLHVPLLPSTHHLISKEKLELMKKTALLINTSRGPVIDEKALVVALKNKVITGAGLDVYEFEPNLAPGLAKLENVIITPHIASARESARIEMATISADNIIDFFEGRVPRNKVNI
ncbi:MAG: D-glycerate dehydrogenase [Candidatus Paceibacterota bacterium]|jgi:lactate dehydrogenase-like 2-hydroxyacid dehydrogenase